MQYRTCPDCGAALDPGERCDCAADDDTSPAEPKAQPASPRRDDCTTITPNPLYHIRRINP